MLQHEGAKTRKRGPCSFSEVDGLVGQGADLWVRLEGWLRWSA